MCVVMAALLIVLMFMNHRRNQERADALRLKTEERKVQETQKMEKAAELYDQYLDQLSGTSVVCWGDAVMAGKGDASLPSALESVINDNLYKPFTDSYSKVVDTEDMTQPGASITNMGVRDEGMREILVRAGVNTMKVGEWVIIPGDTEPQNIVLGDDTIWTPLHFARQDKVSFGKVVINETEGTLTEGEGEYDELHPRFAFVRDEEGDSFQAGAGTEIETENASRYLGDIPVFFFEDEQTALTLLCLIWRIWWTAIQITTGKRRKRTLMTNTRRMNTPKTDIPAMKRQRMRRQRKSRPSATRLQ